ncbi:serine protease [Gallibacterium salpingitidis]|uniref:Serine protease n=1 Tax=Gallibacterium salpingitidis TaxID=505341 RepID=A0AB36E1W4_9PAST|nr:patatin-like phospholipase family protein [Gallibacterium salpingitidis]OBX09868.1 serine protease [Gallibacterium salpingitidis]OBX10015.1 serine protease [Gallibacterium salpingitidis]
MKVGLVLEGGAMRGLYTAGVLDVFLEEKIKVDGIVGVSAGVLFGVNYPSNQPGRVLRYNLKYLNDKRYISLHSLFTTGNIVNKEFAFYDLPINIDPFDEQTFINSGIDFYATLTNVDTGEAEYIKLKQPFKEMEVLRATSAMPFVSHIVEINGKRYLDGGIADSIPLAKCQQLGYDKIIVILTRPLEYRKKKVHPCLFKAFYHQYPKLVEKLSQRYLDYNQKVEQVIAADKRQEIFVIRPSQTLPIKRIEKDLTKIQAMYDLGIADARHILPELQQYLSST